MNEIKLAVCVPLSWTSVPSSFFASFTSLFVPSRIEAMKQSGVIKLWHMIDPSFPLDLSRNRLVRSALKHGATHVLFLDADMTFPQNLVTGLVAANVFVAGALYFKKRWPFQPVPSVFSVEKDPQLMSPIELPQTPGLVDCDVLGMGATLIRREVFEAIEPPWFAYEAHRVTGEMTVTEDVTFCRKAKAAGFRIVCDTRIVCGHIRHEAIGPYHWQAYLDEMKKESKNGEQIHNVNQSA